MFDALTERLSQAFRNVIGVGKLTEKNIDIALKEVRQALLEADVALSVVKKVMTDIKGKVLGRTVTVGLTPGQFFIKIVKDELTELMGQANERLDLKAVPPVVILMAGLQGSGKTTSVAKLAKFLIERENKKVLVASADIYRPAAILQLANVAGQVGAHFFPSAPDQAPVSIVTNAITEAKKGAFDVVILDTAGRLHVDEDMMAEIKQLHVVAKPIETLFVVDAMTGQDAANTAKAFHDALPLTGVILTKADGDARGGAALSIRYITGKPIKFLGVGEKLDALEPFHPDRLASRILGMGDTLSLIEELERKINKTKAEKLATKLHKGQGFDLEDLRDQLKEIEKMGGVANMMSKLPGMGSMAKMGEAKLEANLFKRIIAVIDSMTPRERIRPALVSVGSRKRRIAHGAGCTLVDVNKALKMHEQMQKITKKMGSPSKRMKMMHQLKDKLPPGMMPL